MLQDYVFNFQTDYDKIELQKVSYDVQWCYHNYITEKCQNSINIFSWLCQWLWL